MLPGTQPIDICQLQFLVYPSTSRLLTFPPHNFKDKPKTMFHCSNHLEWFEIRLLVGYCNPYMFGRRNSNHYIVLGSIPSSGSRILLVYIYIFPILYIIVFPPTTIIFSHYNCHIYISLPKPLFFNSIFPVQCAKKHSNCSFLNSHEPGHFSSSAKQLG